MSFRDFTLQKAQHDFGLTIDPTQFLFADVQPIALSEGLTKFWDGVLPLGLAMPTEKAHSELLVAPLLAEVWDRTNRRIGLFSGVEFNVDAAAGLSGVCDFLLSRSPQLLFVEAPVLAVVEAKRDSIPDGLGQCAAEMVAAQRFNQQSGNAIDPVFGCVTTGSNWRFLRLLGGVLAIDLEEYQISQAERLLGVLLYIVGVQVEN